MKFVNGPSEHNSVRTRAIFVLIVQQCDFRFDLFLVLVLVLVFQLFFRFSFVLVLSFFRFSFSFANNQIISNLLTMICLNTVHR